MSIWNILGIEETKDKDAIKRAYRIKLTTVNPEDDAEGFMELRRAYEEAERFADTEDEMPSSVMENRELTPLEQFAVELDEIYKDFYRRISVEEWKKLLDSDVCVSLDTSEDAFYELLRFLMEKYYLPDKIFKLLIDTYSIEERKQELSEKFPQDFIEYIINYSVFQDALDFYAFSGEPDADYDGFVDRYYALERAVRNNQMEEEDRLIAEISGLNISNPCFDVMRIRNLLQKEKYDEAKEMADALSEKYPESDKVMICQGDVYTFFHDNEKTRACYETVLERNPKSYVVRAKLAELDMVEGEYAGARDVFLELLKENHYDNAIRAGVIAANQGLIEQNLKKLDENPEDKRIKLEIAWSYYQSYKFPEALRMLDTMSPDPEDKCEYYNLRGRTIFCLNDYDEALDCFFLWRKAILAIPEDDVSEDAEKKRKRLPYVMFLIGDCYLKKGNYEKAKYHIDEALSKEHDEIVLAMEVKCELEYKMKHYADCLDSCAALEVRDKRNYIASNYMAKTYFALDMYQEAVNACEKTISIYPFIIEPYEIMMKIFMRISDYESVENIIKRYQSLGIKSDVCSMFEARIAIKRDRDYKKARRILEEILPQLYSDEVSDIEDFATFFVILGECYENTDAEEEAFNTYRKAIREDENNPFAYGRLGLLYAKKSSYREAIDAFTKQLELNPSDFYYIHRGLIFRYDYSLPEAIQDFQMAVKMNPRNTDALRLLGDSLMLVKNYMEAERCFEAALERTDDPDEICRMKLNLARIYKLVKNFKRAEATYLELIDDYDMRFDFVEDYLTFLEEQGRLSEAERELKRLYEFFPDRKTSIYHLEIHLLCNIGDVDRINAFFRKAKAEKMLTPYICAAVAHVYMELKQYKLAEETYLLAVDLDKDKNHNYFSELAVAASHQFGGRARVRRYVAALKERNPVPKKPSDLVDYARAARAEKRYADANEFLNRAFDEVMCEYCYHRGCWDGYLEYGHLLEEMGQKNKALLAYEKSLELGGYNFWCLKRIERLRK